MLKELKEILAVLAAGLKSFSESIDSVAAMITDAVGVEEPPKTKMKEAASVEKKPASGKKRGRKAASETGVRKRSGSRGRVKKEESAANYVLKLIGQMPGGANTAVLMEKTGFDKKKVANILYRLKSKNLIINEKVGVYTKIG